MSTTVKVKEHAPFLEPALAQERLMSVIKFMEPVGMNALPTIMLFFLYLLSHISFGYKRSLR